MPSHWIKRTIEDILVLNRSPLKLFPVWLILGPRQVGKSSVLNHLRTTDRQWISLDDWDTRIRAQRDPALMIQDIQFPVVIDEIQYAPQLLSAIKKRVDEGCPPGSVWLTGSQNFEVMTGVQESLAGRVAILNLFGVSDEEKNLDASPSITPKEYFEAIIETSFPKLVGEKDLDSRSLYLSSYTQTYLERNIRELLGIQKRREFEIFLKCCALRTGQVVNYHDLAGNVGVSPVTIKEWLSLLEDSFVISLVHPYHSNRSKRLIKSPKLYFLDMGLAAYLAGWRDPEMLRLGPMGGAAFETHVFGNILRYYKHRALDVQIHFWRDRDGNELDFLVETSRSVIPIEVKMGSPDTRELIALDKIREPSWEAKGRVVSLMALQEKRKISLGPTWDRVSPLAAL